MDSMSKTIGRRSALRAIGGTSLAGLAGCLGASGNGGTEPSPEADEDGSQETDDDSGSSKETVKAALIVDTPVGDLGWAWAHDRGRKVVDEKFDWLETTITDEVAPADSKTIIEQQAMTHDVIFGAAFGYMDPMLEVSEKFPDVAFEHNTGFKTGDNMGLYFGRMYQMRYLLGVAAGTTPDIESAGYVAAFPIPEVIRGINAFSLGALSVDESFTTKVRWTNTWFDPPKETDAAKNLVDEDVDLMVQHQDSPSALKEAARNDIWASGYDAPMAELAGENYFTSLLWKWDAFYGPTVKEVRDGTWEADFYWKGVNAGIVDMDDFGPNVLEETKDAVAEVRASIEADELDVWNGSTFEGWNDWSLYSEMESFVDGIEGKVPRS